MHALDENYRELFKNEEQLLRFWDQLSTTEQESLAAQMTQIDRQRLQEQKKLIQDSPALSLKQQTIEPFEELALSGNRENQLLGADLLKKGAVGCLVLAGGEGSRLRFEGPKGCYPISLIKHKSLFQLCAEKVLSASRLYGRPLQIAFMTSPDNVLETREFFKKNDYFGLDPSQISFFIQGVLPFLDEKGKLFLKSPTQIAKGAAGNGELLQHIATSGLLSRWQELGIQYLNVILIDNPLADPFDAEFAGFHHANAAEISLKCTEKLKPEEKVGVLVKIDNRCTVLEYSELPENEKNKAGSDGRLLHRCANLSLFCFSLSFIQKMQAEKRSLPLHQAWKATAAVDERGNSHQSLVPIAWKFETFIFDWLAYAAKTAAILYPRELCFAPLKNAEGIDSPETVRKSLQERDRAIILLLTGLPPPDFPFELSADFYYPTAEMREQWKGRKISTHYVDRFSD